LIALSVLFINIFFIIFTYCLFYIKFYLRKNCIYYHCTFRFMNVKLFFIMGMFWNWDVMWFFLTKYLNNKHLVDWYYVFFYINAVLNFLEGILIFSFFILKNGIYQALCKRLGLDTKKEEIELNVQLDHNFAQSL